jgi:hypothetical protein
MINNWQTICTLSSPICGHTASCFIATLPQVAKPPRHKPHRHEGLKTAELIDASRNAKIERCEESPPSKDYRKTIRAEVNSLDGFFALHAIMHQ